MTGTRKERVGNGLGTAHGCGGAWHGSHLVVHATRWKMRADSSTGAVLAGFHSASEAYAHGCLSGMAQAMHGTDHGDVEDT